ncbi:PITH domain-containing protein 1 [Elsinoe australis]|uniref:PITH domain-containing protein 1 n=1 Tax=Elsinoe australis TaxID=40998 RepID=A0A4U7BBE7_9PEZI|nr:PITH domain-containing protein 1 [Elsinoe australis]
MSKTVHIESTAQFTSLLSSSRVVVTDFYADWCGPCKAIAPFYEQLSSQLSRPNQITFTKVNTDNQKQIAQSYNITAMPTFMIFKNGRETQRIRGADPKALDAAVKNLAAEASSSDASGSGSAGGDWMGAELPRGYGNVTSSVDQRGLDFLNVASDAGPAKSIFNTSSPSALGKGKSSGDSKDYIESDTDEQLMMFIPFQSTLKVHTLHITSFAPEDDDVMRPKTIKLYTNRSNVLGFDEAESIAPTQTFELDENSYDSKTGTAKLELRFVKFQNVTSIVVFVEDGLGDGEKTRVDRIRLVGETGEKRSMGKLEKIGDEPGE